MKKKLFLCLFLFLLGVVSIATFTTYEFRTTSQDEKFLLANVEALTLNESGQTVNGPGDEKYCASCMTYHTYCKGRNDKSCYHTGH